MRTHQDLLTGERALAANAARCGLDGTYRALPLAEAVAGAHVVLLQLPTSLDELDEIAEAVAAYADPDVVVLAGDGLIVENVRGVDELPTRVRVGFFPLRLSGDGAPVRAVAFTG